MNTNIQYGWIQPFRKKKKPQPSKKIRAFSKRNAKVQ